MNIKITGMAIEGLSIPVPAGLSEILSSAGVWVKQPRESNFIQEYDRRVERRDGNFVTVLTLKKSS
jgi:hypothetical protein